MPHMLIAATARGIIKPLRSHVCDASTRAYSLLDLRNRARAVAELVALYSDLLQQRQVEIRDRRFLRQHQVLAAELHFAVPTTNQDVRHRIVVVLVTVAHVRPEHEDRVVEQCSLPVRRRCHLGEKLRELLHVPGLDFRQLVEPLQIVRVVRHGVKRIRDSDVVVGAVRALRGHDVGNDAGEVGLVRECDQVEHQLHLLAEVFLFPDGSIGNLERRHILCRRHLRAPLDLANAFEIAVQHGAVAASEPALQLLGVVQDQIEDAVGLVADRCALLRRVAFPEQLQKDLARIGFHRQRRIRVAERQRRIDAVIARRRLNDRFRRHFQRRQRRVLADDLRDHLIESHGHVCPGTAAGVRTSATEPRRRREAVNRAGGGRVLEIAERRHVLLVRLERGKNRAEFEIGAGAAGRPLVHGGAMGGVVHDRAVGHVEEAHSQLRRRGGLSKSRSGRHHGVEKRQPQSHSGALQHRSPRKMFLRDEHETFS